MITNYEIIKEELIPLPCVKEILEKIPPEELKLEQKNALEHAKLFSKINCKKAKELVEELKNLNIRRLKENHIVKIAEILPQKESDLKVILGDAAIKKDEIKTILDIVKKYV